MSLGQRRRYDRAASLELPRAIWANGAVARRLVGVYDLDWGHVMTSTGGGVHNSPKGEIDVKIAWIVGVAVLVFVFFAGGVDAVLAALSHQQRIKAGLPQYVEFSQLYLHTWILSVATSLAVGIYGVRRILGLDAPLVIMPPIFIVGAMVVAWLGVSSASSPFTASPFTTTSGGGGPIGNVITAARWYVAYYGPVGFAGGVITGIGTALIVMFQVRKRHQRALAAQARNPLAALPSWRFDPKRVRAELSWMPGVMVFGVGLLIVTFLVAGA